MQAVVRMELLIVFILISAMCTYKDYISIIAVFVPCFSREKQTKIQNVLDLHLIFSVMYKTNAQKEQTKSVDLFRLD